MSRRLTEEENRILESTAAATSSEIVTGSTQNMHAGILPDLLHDVSVDDNDPGPH